MKTANITQWRGVFSMRCGVALNIRAPAARIWNLLTDAKDFPRWNSTVTRVEGTIREGERLRVHVPGTDRTFTPKVSGMVRDERMTKCLRGIQRRPIDIPEVRLRRSTSSPLAPSEVCAISPSGSRHGW